MKGSCAKLWQTRTTMPELPATAETTTIRRLIDVGAVIAAIIVVARTALIDVPQVLPGGAKIGTVAWELSLAYLGAWIFNLLVIVLPRRSDRRLIYRRCDPLIAQYAGSGRAILIPMFAEAHEIPEPQQPDAAALHRVCDKTNPNDNAPLITGGGPGNWSYANWLGLLKYEMSRADARQKSLEPFFPYLEAEAVSLITDLSTHSLRSQVRMLSEHSIENTDFLWLEDTLFGYWETCTRLDNYRINNILPYT